MGVGQVISDTFGTVKARFGPLLGLWATYFGLTIVLSLVFFVGVGAVGVASFAAMGGGDSLTEGGMMGMGAGMLVVLLLFYLVYILVAMAQYASMIIAASSLRQTNFGDAFGAGWRAAPALLLLMLVLLVAYFAVAIVFSLIAAALAAIGAAGTVLFLLLVVPVVVWVACRLAPLFAVVAVDGVRNPFTAISRSWGLTRGHALTIFLAWLAFIVIVVLVCGVLLLPSFGLLASMADPGAMADPSAAGPAVGGFLLLMLTFLVISAVFTMIYTAFLAVIHSSLTGGETAAETFA